MSFTIYRFDNQIYNAFIPSYLYYVDISDAEQILTPYQEIKKFIIIRYPSYIKKMHYGFLGTVWKPWNLWRCYVIFDG